VSHPINSVLNVLIKSLMPVIETFAPSLELTLARVKWDGQGILLPARWWNERVGECVLTEVITRPHQSKPIFPNFLPSPNFSPSARLLNSRHRFAHSFHHHTAYFRRPSSSITTQIRRWFAHSVVPSVVETVCRTL
jgi:hypothetical protein